MGPLLGLVFIVTLVLSAGRLAWCQRVLRYLPTPLWCYLLPMAATAFAWLPQKHPTYGLITSQLLPFALGLLLLNVHLPTVLRVGWRALVAMGAGAVSIVMGVLLHIKSDPIVAALATALANIFFNACAANNLVMVMKNKGLDAAVEAVERTNRSAIWMFIIAGAIGQIAAMIAVHLR